MADGYYDYDIYEYDDSSYYSYEEDDDTGTDSGSGMSAANAASTVLNASSTVLNSLQSTAYNTATSDESWGCCNDVQTNFVLTYFAYCVLGMLVLYQTPLTKPIESMNKILHKLNQAFLTYLTGGDYTDDEGDDDGEPHVTGRPLIKESDKNFPRVIGRMRIKSAINRGCLCLVSPSGYLGTSFWAMCLVISAGGRQTATVFGGVLTAFLIVMLLKNIPPPGEAMMTMAHVAVLVLVTYIEWFVYSPLLQYLILFYAVVSFSFVLIEIKNDSRENDSTKTRGARISDSYAVYRDSWYCCPPKFVAYHWTVCAIVLQMLGVWVAMAEMSDECYRYQWNSWLGCVASSKGVVGAWDGVDFNGWFAQAKNTTASMTDSFFNSANR